jgi:hypothetical protein
MGRGGDSGIGVAGRRCSARYNGLTGRVATRTVSAPGSAGPSARPLARDDGSLMEDLAAPHSAARLGLLKLGGQFGEPQIAASALARQRLSHR